MSRCCICGRKFEGDGNNPEPVKSHGRCCDECNELYVIPTRLAYIGLKNSLKEDK